MFHQAASFEATLNASNFAQKYNYHLSFTGYALAAFPAEISLCYCIDNKKINLSVKAVTFDGPGSKTHVKDFLEHLSVMQRRILILLY